MSAEYDEAVESLYTALDLKLVDIWTAASTPSSALGETLDDDGAREAFAAALRVSYALGYNEALDEHARGCLGAFSRAHQLPPKQRGR